MLFPLHIIIVFYSEIPSLTEYNEIKMTNTCDGYHNQKLLFCSECNKHHLKKIHKNFDTYFRFSYTMDKIIHLQLKSAHCN